MRRPVVLIAAATAALALPTAASADVNIDVPRPLLGGPIATPLPALTPDGIAAGPGRPSRAPGASVRCSRRRRRRLPGVGTARRHRARPAAPPRPRRAGHPARGRRRRRAGPAPGRRHAGSAGRGRGAAAARAGARARDARARPGLRRARQPEGLRLAAVAAHHPALAALPQRDRLQRPGLPGPAAGAERLVEGHPAARADGRPQQGRTYVWVVWPANGPRRDASYALPVGRSTFAVTLRPRIVFRTRGRRAVEAEVRPHIPFGTLRLRRPDGLRARVPRS